MDDDNYFPALENAWVAIHVFRPSEDEQIEAMYVIEDELSQLAASLQVNVWVSSEVHEEFRGRFSPFPYDQYRR